MYFGLISGMASKQFFDIQVNGYGGVDYNSDTLTIEDLRRSCERLHGEGVRILLTLITEHIPVIEERLRKIVQFREQDAVIQSVITGFHVEGPFISPVDGYRGAHFVDAVKQANVDDAKRILEAGGGLVKLITLAPEQDPQFATTQFLAEQGVTVSAGHTNASLDELRGAIDAGLSMYTHLGNGCPMQMHRHDNIVQRALSLSDRLWCCFIADGVHVNFPALSNYMRAAGVERSIVVTDAVAPAGLGPGLYTVGRWELLIGEDMVARAPDGSHFVGAAITMEQSERNLAENLALSAEQIHRLLYANPMKALGIQP